MRYKRLAELYESLSATTKRLEKTEKRFREIEELLSRARRDRSVLDHLGRKLREYGLFEEYEDKFLAFF